MPDEITPHGLCLMRPDGQFEPYLFTSPPNNSATAKEFDWSGRQTFREIAEYRGIAVQELKRLGYRIVPVRLVEVSPDKKPMRSPAKRPNADR